MAQGAAVNTTSVTLTGVLATLAEHHDFADRAVTEKTVLHWLEWCGSREAVSDAVRHVVGTNVGPHANMMAALGKLAPLEDKPAADDGEWWSMDDGAW